MNATDDFLIKRAQGLPQNMAEEMRYTQEEFVPRLMRYRQLSTADETLLDYFDELEIHPEHIGTVLKAAQFILGHNEIHPDNRKERRLCLFSKKTLKLTNQHIIQ